MSFGKGLRDLDSYYKQTFVQCKGWTHCSTSGMEVWKTRTVLSISGWQRHIKTQTCLCHQVVLIILAQHECFGGILESACLSVHMSACVQNISFCQSASGGIKSHLVTALVCAVCIWNCIYVLVAALFYKLKNIYGF